jgi:hypothetical protein
MNAAVVTMPRSVLAAQPVEGPVGGHAHWSDVVRYDDGTTTRYAQVVRTKLAEGLYRLRDYDTGEQFTDALTSEHWTFHGKPNAIAATTKDHTGTEHVWTISALPRFITDEMLERMARKRHFVMHGVPADLVEQHWVHVPGRAT